MDPQDQILQMIMALQGQQQPGMGQPGPGTGLGAGLQGLQTLGDQTASLGNQPNPNAGMLSSAPPMTPPPTPIY